MHVWTLRNEPTFLAQGYGGDPIREHVQFTQLGVDGIFTDFPDTARLAQQQLPQVTVVSSSGHTRSRQV